MTQRLISALAISGLLAVVVVGVVVFQFGRHNPSPPSLAKHPNAAIPGDILYRDNNSCVVGVAASGAERRQLYCGYPALAPSGNVSAVTWVDARTIGFLVYSSTGTTKANRLIEVDLDTKAERDTGKFLEYPDVYGWTDPLSINGERAQVDERGRLLLTRDGVQREIAKFDTRSYQLRPILWSPDGEWLVLYYTPPRDYNKSEIWIVSRDGTTRGTLATDVLQPQVSWRIDGVGIAPALHEAP